MILSVTKFENQFFFGCTLEVYCVVFDNTQDFNRRWQYFSLFAEAEIRKTRGKATEEDT